MGSGRKTNRILMDSPRQFYQPSRPTTTLPSHFSRSSLVWPVLDLDEEIDERSRIELRWVGGEKEEELEDKFVRGKKIECPPRSNYRH